MSGKIFLSCRVSSKHNKAEIKGESQFSWKLRNQSDMHQ